MWNPNVHRDGIRRDLGHESGVLKKRISALMKETSQSSLAPSTMWRWTKKSAVCIPEEGSPQSLTMWAP